MSALSLSRLWLPALALLLLAGAALSYAQQKAAAPSITVYQNPG